MKSFSQFVEIILGKNSANTLGAMSDMHMENDDFLSWITQINRKLRQYFQYAISMAVMKHGLNHNFLPHFDLFHEPSRFDTPENQKTFADTNRRYNFLNRAVGSPQMRGSPFQNSFFEILGELIEGLIAATKPSQYQGMSPNEAMKQLMSWGSIKSLINGSSMQDLQDQMVRYNGSEDAIPPQTKNAIKRIVNFLEMFNQQITTWNNYYT